MTIGEKEIDELPWPCTLSIFLGPCTQPFFLLACPWTVIYFNGCAAILTTSFCSMRRNNNVGRNSNSEKTDLIEKQNNLRLFIWPRTYLVFWWKDKSTRKWFRSLYLKHALFKHEIISVCMSLHFECCSTFYDQADNPFSFKPVDPSQDPIHHCSSCLRWLGALDGRGKLSVEMIGCRRQISRISNLSR